MGFEPTRLLHHSVFKTAAATQNLSAKPSNFYILYLFRDCKFIIKRRDNHKPDSVSDHNPSGINVTVYLTAAYPSIVAIREASLDLFDVAPRSI